MADPLNTVYLNMRLPDVSTAQSVWLPAPDRGKIVRIQSIIDGTIATDDAVLTTNINGVAVTDGAITIANAGSLAGDVDEAIPSGANSVVRGDKIEVATNGASTNAVAANIVIHVRQ